MRPKGAYCLTHPRVTDHLDVTMMSLLLASFPHRYREEYDRAGEACAPHYVRRAEGYVRAHWREPISIGDLAGAAECQRALAVQRLPALSRA